MIIAFSPHLDDAVLSIGGYLAELALWNRRVEVHTLFAGQPAGALSPAAAAFHRLCELGREAVLRRQVEDHLAARRRSG